MNDRPAYIHEFVSRFGNRFEYSGISKAIYSTDASIYQWKPIGVFFPESAEEIKTAVRIAEKYGLPVLCRGGGTSLAGQTVNQAVILDFSRFYDKIISYSPETATIRVQPGVIHENLNQFTAKDGLHFAPDPATSNRATIGGMIANNSSGTRSIRYGKTQDHILSLTVLLSDGTILECKDFDVEHASEIPETKVRESGIFSSFRDMIFRHAEAIELAYPKVMRRVSGYNLDAFISGNTWNYSDLFCGSEGSLGIILEAELKLEPVPPEQMVYMVHFIDRIDAIRHVEELVELSPSAVEMLDFNVLEESRKNKECKIHLDYCIQGDPQAVMLVEFSEMSAEALAERQRKMEVYLKDKQLTSICLVEKAAMKHAWELRKKGLGIIMAKSSSRKPVPFIEDCCVPLPHLAEYVSFILDYCESLKVETVLYAHASVGVLHIRPMLDLRKEEDIKIMKKIGEMALTKVKEFRGSWSGEHGDGRIRSVKLREFFGEEVYNCLKETKKIFDPAGIMNPGIIIDPLPEDAHLRYGPEYSEKEEVYQFKYRKEHSFEDIVHNCSGVGACRKTTGGVMCPSFMATGNETHSTRGRANVLRMLLSGKLGSEGLSSPEATEVMELCISCKACKTECPSSVDMGKLKAEVLQKKYERRGRTLRDRSIEQSMNMAKRLSGKWAGLVNPLMRNYLSRQALSLIGLNPKRKLPAYKTEDILRWDARRHKKTGAPVYLFADSYLKYHQKGLAKKIITVLESFGFGVSLMDIGCCQRPRISNGFLERAKAEAANVAGKLKEFDSKIPILVCEPSCYSSLAEDLPDLMEDEAYENWKLFKFMSLEDFIAEQMDKGKIQLKPLHSKAILHAHCHHRAVNGLDSISRIMHRLFGENWSEPDAGCCGMAGAFGYEKEKDAISSAMAERRLIPAVNKAEEGTAVITNGFSCSHQINDLSEKRSVHWIELIHVPGTIQ